MDRHSDYAPHRGDAVEAWIKRHRDQYEEQSSNWFAIDVMLDDYRLHADLGRTFPSGSSVRSSKEAG